MPGPGKKFKKGNKHGGKREGAGRKPDWFKAEMAKIAGHKDTLEFIRKMAHGERINEEESVNLVTGERKVVQSPVDPKDRLKAIEFAADRAFGKAGQELTLQNPDGTALVLQVPFRDQGEAGKVK